MPSKKPYSARTAISAMFCSTPGFSFKLRVARKLSSAITATITHIVMTGFVIHGPISNFIAGSTSALVFAVRALFAFGQG